MTVRIAVLALALCALTCAPAGASRDVVIASLGDSVASGEGNPDGSSLFRPAWREPRCHRSTRSGAEQAERALQVANPQTRIVFHSLACSGATVTTGLLGPYAGVQPDRHRTPLRAQVEELRDLRDQGPVDAVLVSVGANDVHFGSLALFCASVSHCEKRRFDPRHPTQEAPPGAPSAEAVEAAAQTELAGRYDRLAKRLDAAGIEPGRVIIVEYFDPTRGAGGRTCPAVLPFVTRAEADWARSAVVAPLNGAVRRAAARHGWQVVGGVQEAYAGHGICAERGQRWIVQIPESLWRGARLSGPLHPNEAGHLATAGLIVPVLAKTVGLKAGAVATPPPDDGGGVAWLQVLAGGGAALLLDRLARVVRVARRRRRPGSGGGAPVQETAA
jgi:lysophospholipase L1-like esterase